MRRLRSGGAARGDICKNGLSRPFVSALLLLELEAILEVLVFEPARGVPALHLGVELVYRWVRVDEIDAGHDYPLNSSFLQSSA